MIYLEKILWAIATVLLISMGIYYTFKLNFVQFNFKKMIKSLKSDKSCCGLSPFKTLTMTLGARIGVGSLAGTALAIYYGGIGSIFWIIISTIICSTNTFSESLLGVLYHQKEGNDYIGGPSHYIEKGMKRKELARIYAFALIFAYILGFLTVQSNTIVKSITQVYELNSLLIGIVLSIITLICIFKGLRKIADISSKLVPIMTIIYLALCTYIIFVNIDIIPSVFYEIIIQAFNPKSISIGFITPLIIGFQRGTFSNESGLGTGAIASATSNSNPSKQGFIQVLGIYIETIIICTMTALVIILSNYNNVDWHNINGIEITQYAFIYHFGDFGSYILLFFIILFAFSTIITGYYYGESNLKFLFKNLSNKKTTIFKIAVCLIIIIGGISSPSRIWQLADVLIVFLGLINVYALFSLRREVINEYKKYNKK
jgi:AGCS family alanine or glycine:cation symporter